MEYENGTWIMHGVAGDDPTCLHSVQDAINYIKEVGFLPLFKNDIPGFSLEERTEPQFWWCGNPKTDPWEWRALIARSGEIAYGKFFEKKAGFISKEWLPYFANYRRDGYDFDALWDDEKATKKQKKIMDLFETEEELYSNEIKTKAGFGKGGEKGFEGTLTDLQMRTYLTVRDFRQRVNKKGESYGWAIAVYVKPEAIWGYEYVTSRYHEEPVDSGKAIAQHMMELYPSAEATAIKKLLGGSVATSVKKKKKREVQYPQNLFNALGLGENPTRDQILGLEYAIPMLKERDQDAIKYKYQDGLTGREMAERFGVSEGTASNIGRLATKRLKRELIFPWIRDGYEATVQKNKDEVAALQTILEVMAKHEHAKQVWNEITSIPGISERNSQALNRMGITNVGLLVLLVRKRNWTLRVSGIGDKSGSDIEYALYKAGWLER